MNHGLTGLKDYTDEISEIHKSDKSVMHAIDDIVKTHSGDIKVEAKEGEKF